MSFLRQYIEVKDGITYRVTDDGENKSYKALGEATEPKVLELDTFIKEDKKELVEAIKPIEDFKDKNILEEYGLQFGIDLNKRKTIANMYKDLVAFVESK